jgi:hypothetical protein
MSPTTNLGLNIPDFDQTPWHEQVNNNFKAIDAVIGEIVGITTMKGVWKNSTQVYAQQVYADPDDGNLYQVVTDHVTAAAPSTFTQDREAKEGYWERLSAAEALLSANSAEASAVEAALSAVAASNSADTAIAAAAGAIAGTSGLYFITPAALIADEALTYDVGDNQVIAGMYIYAGGLQYAYKVASNDATDHALVTAGGVKLYVEPTAAGYYNGAAWALAGGADETAVIQAAWDYAHENNADLFLPANTYLVTGLIIPGTVTGTDERGKVCRLFGQGDGEPFATTNQGTVIRSVTDAPVIADILDTNPSSNGTVILERLRIEGNSDNHPAILLQSFYGLSALRDMTVINDGEGDGIEITYTATTELQNLYVMNSDRVAADVGADRTGYGIVHTPSHDAALLVLDHVVMRGWKQGAKFGDGAGKTYSLKVTSCEFSTVYHGIELQDTRKAIIEKCYFEAGEGGTAVLDEGKYTSIKDNFIFPGFSVGIDSSEDTTESTTITGNVISMGVTQDAIGCKVGGIGSYGAKIRTVKDNTFITATGAVGTIGLQVVGIAPTLDAYPNTFVPAGGWSGEGAKEIDYQNTGPLFGTVQDYSMDGLALISVQLNTALSLYRGTELGDGAVESNNMMLGAGSYFVYNPTVLQTINRFTTGPHSNRMIILRAANNKVEVAHTLYNKLAGGASFTGPGIIMFMAEYVAGTTYIYEVARAKY